MEANPWHIHTWNDTRLRVESGESWFTIDRTTPPMEHIKLTIRGVSKGSPNASIPEALLLSWINGDPAPAKPIGVGDLVEYGGVTEIGPAEVLAIDGQYLWIRVPRADAPLYASVLRSQVTRWCP